MTLIVLPSAVLDEARVFFEERGSLGCEGTAMIALSPKGLVRLVIPNQQASPVPHPWVEVTRKGKLQLASALGLDERYIARIHSHPTTAFHSLTDNANPALTFEGAISIVVPFFGLGLRHGLDACAVLIRRSGVWEELAPGTLRNEVIAS